MNELDEGYQRRDSVTRVHVGASPPPKTITWEKFKMADNVFARNPPSRGIDQFPQRNHHDYLSQTDDPAMMCSISKFFYEAEAVLGLLDDKFRDQSRNREVQQLIGTKSMVINALKKIHVEIIWRLCSTPFLANLHLTFPRRYFVLFLTI